jgi:hypothetical protein
MPLTSRYLRKVQPDPFGFLFNDDKLAVPLFIAKGQETAHPRVLPPFA